MKKFALTPDQIKPLATGRGGCIANYSPDITSLLDAPPRSAFERNAETGKLVAVMYEEPLQ